MTFRLPLVLGSNGLPQQLQAGDMLAGSGGNFGAINLATLLGLVADGNSATPTDNGAAFALLPSAVKVANPVYGPPIPVSFSGNTITTLTAPAGSATYHYLRVSDPVVFFAGPGGSLPIGLTSMTPVFAAFSNMGATSFQVTARDPAELFMSGTITAPNIPSITLGGSPSNVYMCTVNADWINLWLPPGDYYTSQNVSFFGPRKFRLFADGVIIRNTVTIGFNLTGAVQGGFFPRLGLPINSVAQGATSITLKSASDNQYFAVGGWLCVGCEETQDTLGGQQSTPFNPKTYEWKQIRTISGVTMTMGQTNASFLDGLAHGYLDTLPDFLTNTNGSPSTGAARIYPAPCFWDCDVEAYGIRSTSFFQCQIVARTAYLDRCISDGEGFFISQCKSAVVRRMTTGVGSTEPAGGSDRAAIITDKIITYLRIEDAEVDTIQVEGSGPELMECVNVQAHSFNGTATNHIFRGCSASRNFQFGPLGAGYTESIVIEGCYLANYQAALRIDDSNVSLSFANAIAQWSFSGGTLTRQFAGMPQVNGWMVIGARGFINDIARNNTSMGAPFQILNLWSGQASTATVTIAGASAPTLSDAVVTWTGNPCSNGDVVVFPGTTPLPSGGQITNITPYWVVSKSGDTMKLAAFLNGPPLQVSGALTSPTANRNPTFNVVTSLGSLPTGASASHTATISVASPAVVDWGTTAPANGTPLELVTSFNGFLPATDQQFGTFNGTISGNLLTVNGSLSGSIFQGCPIVGAGVAGGTYVTSQIDGTHFYVSISQSVGPVAMSCNNFLSQTTLYTVVRSGVGGANKFGLSTDGATAINVVQAGTGTFTAVSNPLKFTALQCPKIFAKGNSGHPYVLDAAIGNENPMWSNGARQYLGLQSNLPSTYGNSIFVWGKLVSLKIEILQVDTVSVNPTLIITAAGWNSSLSASNLSETIDLTLGPRTVTITPAAVTSAPVASSGNDSLATYGDWIGGLIQTEWDNYTGGSPLPTYAAVRITAQTDQGIFTTPITTYFRDQTQSWSTWAQITDTTIPVLGSGTGV